MTEHQLYPPARRAGAILSLSLLTIFSLSIGAAMDIKPADDAQAPWLPFRLRIISSSHQDIAWMDSPEACIRYRDENCITPALEMMRTNPEYCFVMENMLNLVEYLDRHPDRKAEIETYTRQGRMEWGATFTQPYESLLSGEQLIRQVYFGRRWIRKNLAGCDALVYFNPDVPGRALQMQQILSKSGVPYMVMSRYHEGYYNWRSPDGSAVLAYSPGHYGNSSALLNAKPDEGAKAIADKLAKWTPYYVSRGLPPEFPLLHSEDFSKPTDYRPLIALWNAAPGGGNTAAGAAAKASTMIYSSARGFFEALNAGQPKFGEAMGERPNLWLYIHGPTHHAAISAHRDAGRILPAAELFSTVASLLDGSFAGYPAKELTEAWQAAIYPDHGWGGKEGQVTDRLFRKKYEFARDKGQELLERALTSIAGRVKANPAKGTPLVVFNDLSWLRTGAVTAEIAGPAGGFVITDAGGKRLPHQVLPPLPDQAADRVRVEFVGERIPPAGYKTFYVRSGGTPDKETIASADGVIENGFYRVRLAPGGLQSVFDKELGREILNTGKFLGFEIFTLQSEGNGAGEFGRVQQPTMDGFDKLGAHQPVWTRVAGECGPVKDVYRFKHSLPNVVVEERLVFYKTVKRIDCEIALLAWDGTPYREFRVAVPVAAPGGKIAYEVPLGVVEVGTSEAKGTGGPAYGNLVYDEEMSAIRPREIQNFLSVSDAALGVTMTTSVAVGDYIDPTDRPVDYPVLQAILLASRRSCHGQGNWYLQEGDHRYRFSLTSHAPGWRNGRKPGIESNHPLHAVPGFVAAASSPLPEDKSFFSFTADNILLSTVKKAEDDDSVVLRCYDIEGWNSDLLLHSFIPWGKADSVNMIEEGGTPLTLNKEGVALKVGHHAIETVRLVPAKKND